MFLVHYTYPLIVPNHYMKFKQIATNNFQVILQDKKVTNGLTDKTTILRGESKKGLSVYK